MPTESPITQAKRLEAAYLNVFGPPDKRSGDQQLIWADMESFCYAYRLETEKTSLHAIDPLSTIFNNGRKSYWLRARGQIIRALAQPKPVKISRQKPTKT